MGLRNPQVGWPCIAPLVLDPLAAGRARSMGPVPFGARTARDTEPTIFGKKHFQNNGWGTWIRTKINGVRVRCSTVELSPSKPLIARQECRRRRGLDGK